jgi:outer membrane protein assembly factor BamB
VRSFFKKNRKVLNLIPVLIILGLLVIGCAGPTFQGWSGFAASDGMLYFGGIDGKVYAINLSARNQNQTFPGENEWVFNIPSTGVPGSICGTACAPASPRASIYATPIILGDLVCVGVYSGDTGKVVAINRLSPGYNEGVPQRSKGEWTYPSGIKSMGAIVGSPIAADSTLFVGTSDGYLYSIDVVYGENKWQFGTGGKIWTSPAIEGDLIYVSNYDKKIFAISSAGSEVWSSELPASVASSPAVSADSILVGAFDNHLYAIDRANGKARWNFAGGNWFWSTPLIAGNTVYAGCLDNKLYAIDASTGQEVWQFVTNGPIVSAPISVDNFVIVASDVGDLYVLDSATGSMASSIHVGSPVKAPLLADGNTVYVHAGNLCVYAFDIQRGEKVWEFCYSVEE